MNKLAKWYNNILQVVLVLLPTLWVFKAETNNNINKVINIVMLVIMLFTVFLSIHLNKYKKMYSGYIIIIIIAIIVTILFYLMNLKISLDSIVLLLSLVLFPLCLIIIDEVRISDRILGLVTIIFGFATLFNFVDIEFIKTMSFVLIPITFILIYFEENLFLNLLYILSSLLLINNLFDKTYIIIFLVLLELSVLALENKKYPRDKIIFYLIIYMFGIFLFAIQYIKPILPFTILIAILANKGIPKDKYNLLFTANSLDIGGIETSLINLLNGMNFNKYNVTLILEEKKGPLQKDLTKKVYLKEYKVYNFKFKIISKVLNLFKRLFFSLFNYHTYDFSCCYATYSYCGNKLSKIASINSCIFVHNNYKYVYKDINDTKEFFNSRKMNEFRRIIFVSNEARDTYLELYPEHSKKTLVFNNFINLDLIEEKRHEKTGISKLKNKKLLVYVGRLDEDQKKISRLIEIARDINDVCVWIIGDGKDKEKYQKLIKEYDLEKKVLMLGSINAPYNYMDRADYIILTSDYEGFPVVYLESLALKKEIITTFPTSDERIDMYKRTHIISKDNYVEDVKKILKKKEIKNSKINLREIQVKRRSILEKLFEGVI